MNFCRNLANSRAAYFLSRGNENAQYSNSLKPQHSGSSTLEKKLKKPKMPGKYNTLSAHQSVNEACAQHPSHHATNIHYIWKPEVTAKLAQPNAMSDLQSDPFSFLFEQLPTLKELQKKPANTEQHKCSGCIYKSIAATFFNSSTFKRTKYRMHSDSKKSDEGTCGNPQHCRCNRTEHQKDRKQSSKKESEKYDPLTIKDFRETYGEKLFDLLKEAPHIPPLFVEVEQPGVEEKDVRSHYELSLESRPDFLLFENENYRPLSKWTLSEHQSCRPKPNKGSLVNRNEAFRIIPSTSAQPKPSPKKAPTKRIDHKNSIIPKVPGRIAAVGVSKPMPPSLGHNHNSTTHHTRRLTKSQLKHHRQSSGGSNPNPS